MNAGAGSYLGVDVGGTRIKWCVLGDAGQVMASSSLATSRAGEKAVLHQIVDIWASNGGPDVAGLGIAVPGHVDRSTGTTALIPNVSGDWDGFPLAAEVARITGRAPALLNDARAFALAELHHGSARNLSEVVFVTVGTGVGGAIAVGGRLLRNRLDSIGEIGHVTYRPDGRGCGCGSRGCIEAYAGGNAVLERARETGLDTAGATPADLFTRADDPRLAAIVDEAVDALAVGVASVCAIAAAQAVVIGGGIPGAGTVHRARIQERLSQRRHLLGEVRVLPSATGPIAGAIGAAIEAAAESADHDRTPTEKAGVNRELAH